MTSDNVTPDEALAWTPPQPDSPPPADEVPGTRRGEYTGGLAGAYGPPFAAEVVEGLPPILRDMVRGVARTNAVPESAALGMGLVALAGACGGIGRVQPFRANPSWTEPVAVSVAIIIPQHDRARALADLAASLDPFTDEG